MSKKESESEKYYKRKNQENTIGAILMGLFILFVAYLLLNAFVF